MNNRYMFLPIFQKYFLTFLKLFDRLPFLFAMGVNKMLLPVKSGSNINLAFPFRDCFNSN